MYGKFLGIDFKEDTAYLTLIKRGLRQTSLLRTLEFKPTVSKAVSSDEIKDFFLQEDLPGNNICVSVPKPPVTIRVLQFPFSDIKKIEQVYKFELDNLSTFNPDDKIHSYHLAKLTKKSEVIICMYEKNAVSGYLEELNSTDIDPKVLTYGPLAYASINDQIPDKRPALLIDIEPGEISFSVFDENGLRRVRSSSIDNTNLLESKLENAGEEANTVGKDFLISEIKKTAKFFEVELKTEIKSMLVTGSLSANQKLVDLVKQELNRDVSRLVIPDLGIERTPYFSKSYALALYGSDRSRGMFNLRKDQFKYVSKDTELRKAFYVPAALLGLLLLLFFYQTGSRYFELKDQSNRIQSEIKKVVNETFPDVKVIPRPVDFMNSEVNKLRKDLEILEGIGRGQTPLDILRDISLSIPESLRLTIDEVRFDSNKTVKLLGRCESYQEVAEIEKALGGSGMFEKVVRNSTGNAVNGGTKFEISILLKASG